MDYACDICYIALRFLMYRQLTEATIKVLKHTCSNFLKVLENITKEAFLLVELFILFDYSTIGF